MKTINSNFKKNKIFYVIGIFFITGILNAQLHDITVASNFFSPNDITINTGDTVKWTNVGGTHNVNGTQAAYPANQASFGNSVGSGWTYTFQFNVAGVYDYHCDPHQSLGMTGKVTVVGPTSINDHQSESDIVKIYPIPVNNKITFELPKKINDDTFSINIYSNSGELILKRDFQDKTLIIFAKDLSHGLFLYDIKRNNIPVQSGKLVVN